MNSSRTVDEMIMSLPRNEQVIAKRLRGLVNECLPSATEKPYYGLGIPFYSHHRQICYILPSSALAELELTSTHPKRVALCFCQGYLMSNDDGALKAEGRKKVFMMYFYSANDLDEKQIRALLYEAALIDDSFEGKKHVSKQSKPMRTKARISPRRKNPR